MDLAVRFTCQLASSVCLVLAALLPLAAAAQQARADRWMAQLPARFAQADRDADGRLTLAEAQAGMPGVARRFDAIDVSGKGWLSLDEIRAFVNEQLPGRGKSGAPAAQPPLHGASAQAR